MVIRMENITHHFYKIIVLTTARCEAASRPKLTFAPKSPFLLNAKLGSDVVLKFFIGTFEFNN